MKDSSFYFPVDKQDRFASIYRKQDDKLIRWDELMAFSRNAKYPGPEFGMYSTASDLAALSQMLLDGGVYKGRRILSRLTVQQMVANQTPWINSAVTGRPVVQGLSWGLFGDPIFDFPLTTRGSFGHNGAFGGIFWIDPEEGLIRIFLEHLFGSGNENNVFMAMALCSRNSFSRLKDRYSRQRQRTQSFQFLLLPITRMRPGRRRRLRRRCDCVGP